MPTHDVFLSHNSKDKPTVEHLAQRLQDAGLSVWLDEWSLIPGEPWQAGLEKGVAASRTVVVALGAHGMGPWQREETFVALDRQTRDTSRRVIPVLLPGADPQQVTGFLSQRTWVDFRGGVEDDAAFQRLMIGIRGEDLGPTPAGAGTAHRAQPPGEPPGATYNATLTGNGAIAQGPGAMAAGNRGVVIGGNVTGSVIITGDGNVVSGRE